MPTDPRKRQKKLERRDAKRNTKRHEMARARHAGIAERIAAAVHYPVLHCWATMDLWHQGLGWVCLSRLLPNSSVAFAVFLVDRYCLGVKNAIVDITGRFTYDSRIVRQMQSKYRVKELRPADARKIVESAVAYAHGLGLHPHPDYQKAKRIFGAIDVAESTETLEFGKDGKPFFLAGPNDTPERCRNILRVLEHSCGVGEFHYMIPLADPRNDLPESLQRENPRVIGSDETGAIQEYLLDEIDEVDPGDDPHAQ